jgi:hypothetical protein
MMEADPFSASTPACASPREACTFSTYATFSSADLRRISLKSWKTIPIERRRSGIRERGTVARS